MKRLWVAICLFAIMIPVNVLFAGENSIDFKFIGLSNQQIQQQLEFIENRLEAGKKNARYWQYGWTSFYAIGAVAGTVQAGIADNRNDRTYQTVSAVKSSLAFIEMMWHPLPSIYGAKSLENMPLEQRLDKIKKIEKGEQLLRDNANLAKSRYSFWPHFQSIVLNLAGGAVIMANGKDEDAVISAAVGIAVSELQIWTQPYGPIRDLNEYENRFYTNQSKKLSWYLAPMNRGVQICVKF